MRIISGGIVCAFHTLLPPIVIVNETETRENELKKVGIWSSGGRMPHPVERLRQWNYKAQYCEASQMSRTANLKIREQLGSGNEMENGEWRMEDGEWTMEDGELGTENSLQSSHRSTPHCEFSVPHSPFCVVVGALPSL